MPLGTHALLVDDDRGRQPFEDVDIGPRQRGHEALHEGAVGSLRRCDSAAMVSNTVATCAEPETPVNTVSRASGVDADVLEVVLPGAVDPIRSWLSAGCIALSR